MEGHDLDRAFGVLEERLAGIGRELSGRMDRLEDATTDRIDRLDASINGRFGRTETRLSALELEAAERRGAEAERVAHGLPVPGPPPPAGVHADGSEVAVGASDMPRWARVLAFVVGSVASLGALLTALGKMFGV